MNLSEIETKPFELFNKDWAVISVGDKDNFNFMTISWGAMGTLWNKPVVIVFVNPARYTYEFMNKYDYFTVSTFDQKYRKALADVGTYSGRDVDKLKISGFTPKILDKGIAFNEANKTYVLKKIYTDHFKKEEVPSDAHEKFYTEENEHYIYIGELVEVI